jgi:hypothetical protein
MPGAPELLHTATYVGPLRNGTMHGEGTIKFDATKTVLVTMRFINGTASHPEGSKTGKITLGDDKYDIVEYVYENAVPTSTLTCQSSQGQLKWRGDTLKAQPVLQQSCGDADLARISDVLQSVDLVTKHLQNVHHVLDAEFFDFEPPAPEKPDWDVEFENEVAGKDTNEFGSK